MTTVPLQMPKTYRLSELDHIQLRNLYNRLATVTEHGSDSPLSMTGVIESITRSPQHEETETVQFRGGAEIFSENGSYLMVELDWPL